MKKILIALSLLIALPATVAAATPQEVYKALLQSYTSMSVMQQPNYAVAGQEGRLSLYVQDAMTPSQDNGSILMWYKTLSQSALQRVAGDFIIQGKGNIEGETMSIDMTLSMIVDNEDVYMQIRKLNMAGSALMEDESVMMMDMLSSHIQNKWIHFSQSDLGMEEGMDEEMFMHTLGVNADEIGNQIMSFLSSNDPFIIGKKINETTYAISLNKETLMQLVSIIGEEISPSDLQDVKLQGTINTDLLNPLLTLENSWLDKHTKLRARWSKDRIVLNMTDMMMNINSTTTFAKKNHGFGLSFKNDQADTFDMTYLLSPAYDQTVRVKALIEGTAYRLDMKGRYYDASGQMITIPTENVVSADELFEGFMLEEPTEEMMREEYNNS